MQSEKKGGIRLREKFAGQKILVIGDVMVDEYVVGKVKRISPEAPIPILNYAGKSRVAGGASNVAQNAAGLGADVEIAGVVGADDAGAWIRSYLSQHKIATDGLITEIERPTTIKRRFATKNQQLLRVDVEDATKISCASQKAILEFLKSRIGQISAVILSDYRKGVLESEEFVKEIIQICRARELVITVDSKTSRIGAFAHATFVKPNNLELEQASGVAITNEETLDAAGRKYLKKSGADALIVTRGAMGISVFEHGRQRRDFPSRAVQVYDVTGAGDTVISTATMALVAGVPLADAVVIGNIAAGIVISRTGTVPVTIEELEHALNGQFLQQENDICG